MNEHLNQNPNEGEQNSSLPQSGQSSPTVFPPRASVYTPPPPKKKPHFEGVDTLFAWLSILAGVLLARALPVGGAPTGTLLALLLLLALTLAYLLYDKRKLSPVLWVIPAYAVLLSIGLLNGENTSIRRWTILAVLLCLCLLSCFARGLTGKGIWSGNRLFCTLYHVFAIPSTSLPHLFGAVSARHEKAGKRLWRTVGWCALGLVCAILPCTVIIVLLSYDAQFSALLDKLVTIRVDGLGEWIGDLLLGLVIAVLLFGTLFGGKHREKDQSAAFPMPPNCRVLPRAMLCAFVTPILAIYAIFFVSQWSYYVSAFTHTLPEGLTFAEYARGGFFELCGVSAFNAGMLLLFHVLMKPKPEGRDRIKAIYTALISLFTLVLIATALSKMALYIDSYGLTQKRVYASWFMLLLATIFLLTLLAQLIKRLRLSAAIPVCCALLFAVIAFLNVEGMIASYNVDAYLDGRLSTVDIYTIELYGTSSVPALVRIEEELSVRESLSPDEQELLRSASSALDRWATVISQTEKERSPFFSFDIPSHRARKLLRDR